MRRWLLGLWAAGLLVGPGCACRKEPASGADAGQGPLAVPARPSTDAGTRLRGAFPLDAGIVLPTPVPVPAPTEAIRLFREADLAFQRKELDAALELVRRSLQQEPRSFLARNLHGRILAEKSKRDPKLRKAAKDELRAALELNPSFWPAAENLADLLRADGSKREAAELYERVLAAQKDHPRKEELSRFVEEVKRAQAAPRRRR